MHYIQHFCTIWNEFALLIGLLWLGMVDNPCLPLHLSILPLSYLSVLLSSLLHPFLSSLSQAHHPCQPTFAPSLWTHLSSSLSVLLPIYQEWVGTSTLLLLNYSIVLITYFPFSSWFYDLYLSVLVFSRVSLCLCIYVYFFLLDLVFFCLWSGYDVIPWNHVLYSICFSFIFYYVYMENALVWKLFIVDLECVV